MEVLKYKKSKYLLSFIWIILPNIANASDSARGLWSDSGGSGLSYNIPIQIENLPNLAIALVYLLVFSGGVFAFMSIMVAIAQYQMTSGNDDKIAKAEHKLISGFVSLAVAVLIYFSIEYVFDLVQGLSSKIA